MFFFCRRLSHNFKIPAKRYIGSLFKKLIDRVSCTLVSLLSSRRIISLLRLPFDCTLNRQVKYWIQIIFKIFRGFCFFTTILFERCLNIFYLKISPVCVTSKFNFYRKKSLNKWNGLSLADHLGELMISTR